MSTDKPTTEIQGDLNKGSISAKPVTIGNIRAHQFGRKPRTREQMQVHHRLTVVEKLYHQVHGNQPVSIGSTYSIPLATDEEAYNRKTRTTNVSTLVDFGWLQGKTVAMLIVKNNEKPGDLSKIIELSIGSGVLLIAAGTSARFCPKNPSEVSIRADWYPEIKNNAGILSRAGCSYTITAIPG